MVLTKFFFLSMCLHSEILHHFCTAKVMKSKAAINLIISQYIHFKVVIFAKQIIPRG
jgi:hypothetical protein